METLNPPANLGLQFCCLPGRLLQLRIVLMNSIIVCAFEAPRVQGADLGSNVLLGGDLFRNGRNLRVRWRVPQGFFQRAGQRVAAVFITD